MAGGRIGRRGLATMPPAARERMMDVTGVGRAGHQVRRKPSHCDTEVGQVAIVTQLTGGGYHVEVTETELSLIKSAVEEAERVSRFGIEVLDDADHSADGKPAQPGRLREEIDDLAMREASLRSLRKTIAEMTRDAKPVPQRQHAGSSLLRPGSVPRARLHD
jgi:hypothetical protein